MPAPRQAAYSAELCREPGHRNAVRWLGPDPIRQAPLPMTPRFVNSILESEALWAFARVLITFMYWF
ncbi:MAG TPA: hypothetical protein VM899_11025, partial [Rubellimicrobium sp.]|nr:hypothetical protein [Rubellimicrobium sp.]